MNYLKYDMDLFDEIYTACQFYSKENVNFSIFTNMTEEIINNSISI